MRTVTNVKLTEGSSVATAFIEVTWSAGTPWRVTADALEKAVTQSVRETLEKLHEDGGRS